MPHFEFIDTIDPAARTKVKSYVARKANRERRLRQIEVYRRHLNPLPKYLPFRDQTSTSTPGALQSDRPNGQDFGKVSARYSPKNGRPLWPRPSGRWAPVMTQQLTARCGSKLWTRCLKELDIGNRHLLQWYLSAVPELSFNVSHDASVHPVRDSFFPLIGGSPEVLHSSLLIIAVNNPTFSSGENGAARVLIQKGKTIRVINEALQRGPTALRDEVLYAVATTALAEDRLGSFTSSRIHLDGLKHMIRLRGGIRSLTKSFPICGVLAWVEISISNQTTPLISSKDFKEASDCANMSAHSSLEAEQEEDLFCRFLNRLKRMQLSKRRCDDPTELEFRKDASFPFRRGSDLLTMLSDSDPDPGIITPISRMNANNCQLACLFYIHFMLCYFHDYTRATATFLARLSSLVRKHGKGKVPRVSLFAQVIVREIVEDDSWVGEVGRLEWLIKMIRLARRLSPESGHMLHQALLDSLTIYEPVGAGLLISNDLGNLDFAG